jgi:putative DNA-invertase from lambdoid prophage Rac
MLMTPSNDTGAKVMGRVFAYCRVSTAEQTVENQMLAIGNQGYEIEGCRVISETISGSVPAMKRQEFSNLINNKLESADTLVVLKLDRLGRDNIDVQQTIAALTGKGVNIVCLDLPVANLSSSEGRLMLQMFAAFSEFERNRIRERTVEGLHRVKANGKRLGRPFAIGTRNNVYDCKEAGLSQKKTTIRLGISLSTVKRHWNMKR